MIRRLVGVLPAIAMVIALLASILLSSYQLSVATYVMMTAIVCLGLVLTTGAAGMISFGQAAFVGCGAYISAYLTTAHGWSPWAGLVAALAGSGAVATVVGAVTVRMSGHYLALVTLCVCISFYFLAGNTESLGRFNGLSGIPPIMIGDYELKSERTEYLFVACTLAGAVIWVNRLLKSRVGRVLRSLRTGPRIAESFGASAHNYRLLAFVISALLAALSGWLYAHIQRFVNPTPFGVVMSIEYLFMTVIGGSASIWGAMLGTALVATLKHELQDLLRPLFGPTTRLEMLIFATVMIFVLIKARRGLWPYIMLLVGDHQPKPTAIIAKRFPRLRPMPQLGSILLSAEAMRRTFGGLVAVDNVSFDVRAGEILGLLGPNGAGKSTLFNLITGVLPATEGRVTILGKTLSVADPSQICRLGVARTFQHIKIVTDMTLLENVAIGATHLGRAGLFAATLGRDRSEEQEIMAWSMALLERVGLGNKAFDLAGSLPLGHQRVLEIARALAADPALLLLDEPAAGLRAGEKTELATLLQGLRDQGMGILLVEHDMEFIGAVADRLMVMNFGRQIAIGAAPEVRANALVQEAYLGAVL